MPSTSDSSSASDSSTSGDSPLDDYESSQPSPPPPKNSNDSPRPKESPSPPPPPSTKNNNDNGSSNGEGSSSSSFSPPPPRFSPPSTNNGDSSPPPPKSVKPHRSTDQDDSSPAKSSGKSHKDTESSDNSGGSGGMNGKAIAGVAIGAGLLIMILICCIAKCSRRKKKKNQRFEYYSDAKGGGQYNQTGEQQNNWQNGYQGQGGDYVLKVPPQAGPMQQQGATSGEMSGNYSGPYRAPMPPPSPNIALGFNKSTFSYEELAAATNGFSDANVLGQGGFGYVHKGILPNGKEIAVKSLKSGSGQGEREFQAEVEIISRVHHRHLVSLVGYCIAGGQRMLVYEYVPNNNLEHHLHGKGLPVMDFETRLRIALGSAKGLAYLHEDCHPRIIHRDIKAANILLDFNFEAMVADFGLAKLSSDTHTHVSTRVMGTFGYLAPEYASSGKLTEKSDVFSFGVMLLELIIGRRPVDPYDVMEDSLVDWARPLLSRALEDGNYDQLADPRLERIYNPQEMQRMISCAGASIRHSARKRPKMSQIVRALEGNSSLDDLNEGAKAGQSSVYGSSITSTDYSQSSYNADMQRFRQLALSSQEFPSSDYGASSNDSREMNPRANF